MINNVLNINSSTMDNGAIDWTYDGGNNTVFLTNYTPSGTSAIGTPATSDFLVANGSGAQGYNLIQLGNDANINGLQATSYLTSLGTIQGARVYVNGGTIPGLPGIYAAATQSLGFATNTHAAGAIDANQNWRIGEATVPTISSGACGTGTNGTIAAGGNNQGFEVLIGSAATTTCTITFANSGFVTAPREAQITAADSAAAAIGTTGAYVSSLGTTSLVITGTALANADYYVQVQ